MCSNQGRKRGTDESITISHGHDGKQNDVMHQCCDREMDMKSWYAHLWVVLISRYVCFYWRDTIHKLLAVTHHKNTLTFLCVWRRNVNMANIEKWWIYCKYTCTVWCMSLINMNIKFATPAWVYRIYEKNTLRYILNCMCSVHVGRNTNKLTHTCTISCA